MRPIARYRNAVLLTVGALCIAAPALARTATAPPTLAIAPATVSFGTGEIVLSGTVAGGRAGEEVTILSQPCGFREPAEIATTRTTAGGAFRFRVQPMLDTRYRVRADWNTSRAVSVRVKPVLRLTRAAAGRYRVHVSTTNPVFQDGKFVLLQQLVGKRWVTVKRARLSKASPETAITVVSAANISVRVKGTLRAVLPEAQSLCYLGGISNTVRA